MHKNNSSGNILLWVIFSSFIILLVLSFCEYLYMHIYNTLIRSTCMTIGLLICSIFLEYIMQFKVFKNKNDRLMWYNSTYMFLVFYIIINSTNFNSWIFIIPTIVLIISLMRYNDTCFKN